MSPSSKWIEGLEPEGGVYQAARLSLESRLKAVAHLLPLAADLAHEDVEHVHRLRVATRRAMAALKLYRGWLPRRPYRWMKKRLRAIRQAAGEARDLDVLSERLNRELGDRASVLVGQLADQRAAAQPAIKQVARRSSKEDRFLRKMHLLLAGIGPRDKNGKGQVQCDFRHWARGRLDEVAAETFGALPTAASDPVELHQFRIRIKALRYAIELLAPALGPDLRDVQYPIVGQIQERLGKINDHAAGAARLEQWSQAALDPHIKELIDALVQQERIRLAEAIADFRQWWTPERVAQLQTGLAAESA